MMKTDLAALFLSRQPCMAHEESDDLLQACNEDLEFIESFVLVSLCFRASRSEFLVSDGG